MVSLLCVACVQLMEHTCDIHNFRVYQREHYADHSYKAVISSVVMLLVSV